MAGAATRQEHAAFTRVLTRVRPGVAQRCLVLPKSIRQSLNTPPTALFEAEVVGNRLELRLAEPASGRLPQPGKLLVGLHLSPADTASLVRQSAARRFTVTLVFPECAPFRVAYATSDRDVPRGGNGRDRSRQAALAPKRPWPPPGTLRHPDSGFLARVRGSPRVISPSGYHGSRLIGTFGLAKCPAEKLNPSHQNPYEAVTPGFFTLLDVLDGLAGNP